LRYQGPRSLWLRYFDPKHGVVEVTLVVEDGVVKRSIRGFERVLGVDSHLDLSNLGIAIPGAIDIHEHLRGLELEHKEDEVSGSLAAAKGGFTLVIDMPNTRPEVRSIDVAQKKLESLRLAVVDYGLLVGLPQKASELREMLYLPGVVGLKLYPEDLPRFEKSFAAEVSRAKALLVVHAEHPMLIKEACGPGERWLCRPVEAEIAFLTELRGKIVEGVRLHVTHVTNVATLAYAKRIGATVDTCPHYILLSSDDERSLGCLAKVNPPLRPPGVGEELLSWLPLVDALSTDHAPHTAEEKSADFSECPSGIASNEIALSLTLDLVSRGLLVVDDVVRLWSLGPARILGLTQWGCIEEGCVASYTILDMKRVVKVDPSMFVSKAKVSPYTGWKLQGAVAATVVRGRAVYLEGEFLERCCGEPVGA